MSRAAAPARRQPPAGHHDAAGGTHRNDDTARAPETLSADAPALDDRAAGPARSNAAGRAWAAGRGVALDPQVRADMQARFGADFGAVRVHDDAGAHDGAERLGATAVTVGEHIAFARGAYLPQSQQGRRLLAHELAHVVQQRRGGPQPALSPQAAHEQAAESAAAQVAAGAASVTVQGATGVGPALAPAPRAEDQPSEAERAALEQQARQRQAQERAHAELVLAMLALRRREYRFHLWFAKMQALQPGVVWSATTRLLGAYGFGSDCSVASDSDTYLREFDRAVSLWAAATGYRHLRRGELLAPLFDPEGHAARMNEVILDELPDGSGYVGRREDFLAAEREQIKARNLRTAENIAGGLFGAIGWGLGGDEGSDRGASVDSLMNAVPGGGGAKRRSRSRGSSRAPGRPPRTAGRTPAPARPPAVAAAAPGLGTPSTPTPAAPANAAATAADPLVVVRIQGRGKGPFFRQGTPEFERHAGSSTADGRPRTPPSRSHVVLPESQARALGFRAVGEAAGTAIEPRRIDGVAVESTGAGRRSGHPITARTARKPGRSSGPGLEAPAADPSAVHGFDRTIKADSAQAQGYNALLDRRELGLLRPNNVSTGGVDAITAQVDPRSGKARIFLNDFTSPGTSKGSKETHARWFQELRDATQTGRLDFGGRRVGNTTLEAALREAIDAREVYVRPVFVSLPAKAGAGPRPSAGTAAPDIRFGKLIRLTTP